LVLAGDLAYSRVAHSTTELWETLGGTVRRIGLDRVKDDAAWEEALAGGVEAVMMLRTQHERREPGVLSASLPSQPWLTVDRLDRLSPLAWVMHPGPVHWGCELAMEFRDDRRSLIDTQVRYGVGLRMACLYWLVQQRYAVIREVFEDALTSEDAGMVP
jgi:aspartate carbamoyltransferase catalytic subunit